ncbi:hypothetical protein D9M72_629700 [compost metagenome]
MRSQLQSQIAATGYRRTVLHEGDDRAQRHHFIVILAQVLRQAMLAEQRLRVHAKLTQEPGEAFHTRGPDHF